MNDDKAKSKEHSDAMASGLRREDWERLYGRLMAHFLKLTGGRQTAREVARDLTQETLLRAHRNLKKFRGRSQLDTWVISIAKNVWLQHLRYHQQEKRSAEEVSLDGEGTEAASEALTGGLGSGDPEDLAVARERLAWAQRQLAGMPGEMRDALMLSVVGYRYGDIAKLLRISMSRVSSLIHQARQRLRKADPDRRGGQQS